MREGLAKVELRMVLSSLDWVHGCCSVNGKIEFKRSRWGKARCKGDKVLSLVEVEFWVHVEHPDDIRI